MTYVTESSGTHEPACARRHATTDIICAHWRFRTPQARRHQNADHRDEPQPKEALSERARWCRCAIHAVPIVGGDLVRVVKMCPLDLKGLYFSAPLLQLLLLAPLQEVLLLAPVGVTHYPRVLRLLLVPAVELHDASFRWHLQFGVLDMRSVAVAGAWKWPSQGVIVAIANLKRLVAGVGAGLDVAVGALERAGAVRDTLVPEA